MVRTKKKKKKKEPEVQLSVPLMFLPHYKSSSVIYFIEQIPGNMEFINPLHPNISMHILHTVP